MLKFRSLESEIIDLGPDHYTMEEYDDCMIKLDQVGKWLGGDRATFAALQGMDYTPQSILDVGCGGGFFATKLALRYPRTQIVGIDLNPHAIEFARRRPASMSCPPPNVRFETRLQDQLTEPSKSYDVVLSTLVCHHMENEKLIDFISSARRVAKHRVILNDLHRHPLALYLFKIIAPICFRNRLVQHDGPLSIRRAFTHDELTKYLQRAEIHVSDFRISWHWAFRWIIEIHCKGSAHD